MFYVIFTAPRKSHFHKTEIAVFKVAGWIIRCHGNGKLPASLHFPHPFSQADTAICSKPGPELANGSRNKDSRLASQSWGEFIQQQRYRFSILTGIMSEDHFIQRKTKAVEHTTSLKCAKVMIHV
jgi:hypothetical protein